jgi:RNA polymerase sigma factor (sigma-70 family)
MTTADRSERRLVQAAQRGDRNARDLLVDRYLPLVYNMVGRALGNRPDIDDVVQECMLRVVRDLTYLRRPERFRSWVGSVVVARISTYRKENADAAGQTIPLGEIPEPTTDFEGETILRLQLSGQRREVAEAGRWLDEGERLVLSLWWLETIDELSRSEIAASLGVTVAYAGVRIQRMRTQLDTGRAVVAALTTGDCSGLAVITTGWDGRPNPLWRKRIARHVRECPVCQAGASDRIPAERLLAGLLLIPVPSQLRDRLTASAIVPNGGGPAPTARSLSTTWSSPAITVTAAVAAAALVTVLVLHSGGKHAQPGPVAAALTTTAVTSPTPFTPSPSSVPTTAKTRRSPSAPTPALIGRAWARWPMPNAVNEKLPHPAVYTVRPNGTVRDDVTGLVWQRSVSPKTYSYDQAGKYCSGLALDGGGWHLPTRIELTSIIDPSRSAPAIDTEAFPHTPSQFFWSSTPWFTGKTPLRAWTFNFYEGLASNGGLQSGGGWVRCVRSPAGQGSPAYQISTRTVTDPATGLTWQRLTSPGARSPQSATKYCTGLVLDGKSDWRLPTIKELATTVDDTRGHPAVDTTAFPGTVGAGWYWSSTDAAAEPGHRWALGYDDGYTNYRIATTGYARCVR